MKISILLIDDDKEILDEISELLTDELTCEVDSTTSSKDAFELAKKNKYDIILTDHKMPDMSGKELIEKIRKGPGLNQNVPIIILSGFIQVVQNEMENVENVNFFDKMYYMTNLIPYIKMILS